MYREKYIKYKNKYLELQNQFGGLDPMTFMNLLLLAGLGYVTMNDIQEGKTVVCKSPASAFLYVNEDDLSKKITEFIAKNALIWEEYINFLSQLDSKEIIVAMTILENKNHKEYKQIMDSRNDMRTQNPDKLNQIESDLKEKLLHITGVAILPEKTKEYNQRLSEIRTKVDQFATNGITYTKMIDFFVSFNSKIDYDDAKKYIKELYRGEYDKLNEEYKKLKEEGKLEEVNKPLVDKFNLGQYDY
jgi:hypothetical protein